MFSRQDCIYTLNKYDNILSVMDGYSFKFHEYNGWQDEMLNEQVIGTYKYLKGRIAQKISVRYRQYISNRACSIPNKTSDKEFFRFMNASGFSEKNLYGLPISRLIKIYSVYFKKLPE